MKFNRHSVLAAAFGLLAVQMPGLAGAAVSWSFNSGNCVSTSGPSGNCGSGDSNFAEARTYGGGTAGDVTVSGWANTTGGNEQLELGLITHYGGGLGVKNADAGSGDASEGSSPEHAVDNDDRFDLVLFDFGTQLVELSQISIGWYSQDADVSILAYTGDLDPTDASGADYIGDREAWWNSSSDNNEDLTSNGWTVVDNSDIDTGTGSSYSESINAGNVASSYWLVSAYNPVFGGCTTDPSSYCQSDYEDYFKIASLTGDLREPPPVPPSEVPAPATLALLGLGLAGMGFKRRATK